MLEYYETICIQSIVKLITVRVIRSSSISTDQYTYHRHQKWSYINYIRVNFILTRAVKVYLMSILESRLA
jgi:hypothetical protein